MNNSLTSPVAARVCVRRKFLLPLLGALFALAVSMSAAPTTGTRVDFSDSVLPLSGPVAATARPLIAAELTGTMDLSVLLQLRDADELQARVNRNEIISYSEMDARYLPLAEDYANVVRWLQSEGFTITRQDDSHLGIYLRGTVAQVQQSFQTPMVHVTVDGTGYPTTTSAPSLPATIAGPVLGMIGFQPYLKLQSHHREIPLPTAKAAKVSVPVPLAGATTSSTYPVRTFSPAQILTAYNGASLTNFTGTGQNIAILADVLPATSDLSAFWSRQGVTRTGAYVPLTPNGTSGTTTPGVEVTLDTEWSSSIAPGANVRVYAAGSTQFSAFGSCLQQMINDIHGGTPIQQLSISYGIGEIQAGSGAGSYFMSFDNQYMLVLSGLGVSIFSSTGDSGSYYSGNLQTSYYSTSPNITAVGGTSLGVNSDGTHLGDDTWSGSGGGASAVFSRPSWQTGTGVPTGSYRLVPDVSLPADPYTGCNLTFNGQIYDYNGNTSGTLEGGTSWSSPTWAGYCARINQSRASQTPARPTLGLVASRVYPLIGTNNFYDVTTGSNASTGSNGLYAATIGYDEATGIGTPNMANLLASLSGPVITGFTPSSGAAGTIVTISGQNLNLVSTVRFNNTYAAFTIVSATQVRATVPNGATNGPITVANPTVTTGVSGDAYTSTSSFIAVSPDVSVTQTANGTFTQGDAGDTYTLTVNNVGTGPTSGTLTFTENAPQGLTVTGLSGTGWTVAANKLSATRNDALAAGSSYSPLTLTVNVAINAPSSVTNSATVSGGGESNTSNNGSIAPTNIAAATPTQNWRYQYFGITTNDGNAADGANPSGDGLSNLLKYALGLNPTIPKVSPISVDVSTGYLRLTVPRNANATDIKYNVQVNGDLTNAAGWSTTGTTVDPNSTASLLKVSDNTPVSGTSQRFIRLQISR